MKNNIKYWNNYYQKFHNKNTESNFAKFIKKKLIKKKDTILDVATGDGRDAFFFQNLLKLFMV